MLFIIIFWCFTRALLYYSYLVFMLEITLFRHSISKINYTLQIHPHPYMLWKHIYVSQLKNKAIIRHSQHRFIKGRSRLSNLLFSDKVACLVDERNPRESFWILVRLWYRPSWHHSGKTEAKRGPHCLQCPEKGKHRERHWPLLLGTDGMVQSCTRKVEIKY